MGGRGRGRGRGRERERGRCEFQEITNMDGCVVLDRTGVYVRALDSGSRVFFFFYRSPSTVHRPQRAFLRSDEFGGLFPCPESAGEATQCPPGGLM